MRKLGWLLVWVVVWCGWRAGAQQDETAAPVRVARLTYFAGAVEVQRTDNTGADDPVTNMPLGEGTRLLCGDYGQAEVEFEDGSLMRVTPRSSVSIDGLGLEGGVAKTQVTVLGGLAYFELRASAGYTYTVGAGGVAMSPVENTVVRVSVGDGPAVFSALSGSVRVERGFVATVKAGESLHADAKDETRYFLAEQVPLESWDAWNSERDLAGADEADKRTTARDSFAGVQGYGWADLDAHGTWYDVPGQGQIWQPDTADEGFDPYGYGDWVWQGVGYVWASGYQWGWTPFRCGHWEFFSGFGWGWEPDGRCGGWGSGGGQVLLGRRLPRDYKPILPPDRLPVKTHPILIVRGPNGPRPPMLVGSVQRVHGVMWTPLVRLGGVARTGPALGLSRDYPVSVATHLAVVGKVPQDETLVVANPVGTVSDWRRVRAVPVAGGVAAPAHAAQQPGRVAPPMPARTAVPGVTSRPGEPVATPVYRAPAPVAAPAVRAPASAPAPVYRAPAPAPAPAAPAQAAPKTETSKPKDEGVRSG